jgi:alkanesulfonate monooxygenase SsuD/methylene tetrahydromethanopterin reductase-like flavin-dependent oxidoreductase (luciferase family)
MEFGLAPVQSESTIDAMLRQASMAEGFGFATVWAQEHHSLGMMYPSPLITLTALAGHTKKVGLGTNMLLLPLYNPVRVAEAAAMVDMFSGGRLRLGVSAGYSETDFRVSGVELDDRARRMREGVPLIRRLWTEETVSAKSVDYELEEFRLFPKPLQKPSPPIYMGGTVPAAIRRAARFGDEFLISATQNLEQIRAQIAVYHEALRGLGQDPQKKRIAINRVVHVASGRHGKELAADALAQQFLRNYQNWGHQTVTAMEGRSRTVEEVVAEHFIVGEPTECVDTIEAYASLGIGHICCFMQFGRTPIDLAEASLRRFGDQVIPRFQGGPSSRAADERNHG